MDEPGENRRGPAGNAPPEQPAATDLDFKLLFENAPGLCLVLRPDPAFTIAGASEAWLLAHRTERGRIVGRGLFEVFPAEEERAADAGRLRASLERVLAGKSPDAMGVQARGPAAPNGGGAEERFWNVVNSPVLSAGGAILYIVQRADDVTEFIRACRSAQVQREAIEREFENFCYAVSHDLRAPLRAIDGFSRIVEEDYGPRLDAEGRRVLGVVRDNSQKMARLLEDLLDYSRLGRKPLADDEIDMDRLAAEALREASAGAARPPDLMSARLPPARGDAALVRRVWLNLFANAVKFSGRRERPLIEVSGHEDGTANVYRVRDNGVGFDMQSYDRLFGVFQRLHPERDFPGTGIGLAIVRRVVARHGGRTWAESRPQEGATFYFSLPKGAARG